MNIAQYTKQAKDLASRNSLGRFCASDLQTARGWLDLVKRSLTLHRLADRAEPTATHRFLTDLLVSGKLLRVYTQNFDALEQKSGLQSGLSASSPCIPLHGSTHYLRCQLCLFPVSWRRFEEAFSADMELLCPSCGEMCAKRQESGKRASAIGKLRPAITLANEEHPEADLIQQLVDSDAAKADFLLILGTSLRTYGPRMLAKQFSQEVRSNKGTVAYINRTQIAKSLSGIVDYSVTWSVKKGWPGK